MINIFFKCFRISHGHGYGPPTMTKKKLMSFVSPVEILPHSSTFCVVNMVILSHSSTFWVVNMVHSPTSCHRVAKNNQTTSNQSFCARGNTCIDSMVSCKIRMVKISSIEISKFLGAMMTIRWLNHLIMYVEGFGWPQMDHYIGVFFIILKLFKEIF